MECFQPNPVTRKVFYVNHWTQSESPEKKTLNITVFPDDTILRVLTKIAVAMGKKRLPYAWRHNKPLLFVPSGPWTNDGYHVNPWKSKPRDNALQETPKLTFDFQELISSNATLNITYFEDVPRELQNDYYFPEMGVKLPSDASLKKEESLLESIWMDSDNVSSIVTLGTCIYTTISYEGRLGDVVLSQLFEELIANKRIPFIQWVDDKTRVLYKVFEKHTVPDVTLKQWMDFDRLPMTDGAIVMYAPFNGTFVKMFIDTRGQMQVLYKADSRIKTSLKDIETHFTDLSAHISSVIKKKITFAMTSVSLRTELFKSEITLKALAGVMAMLLPVFHIVDLTSSSLTAVYKRCSNYKTIDITESIRGLLRFGNMTTEEVAQRLISTYGITLAEAMSYIEQASAMDDAKPTVNKKIESGLHVQIAPISLGFRVIIDQAPTLDQARTALFWVISALNKVSPKTKPKPKPVRQVPIPTTTAVVATSSSSFSASTERSLSSSLSVGGGIGKEYQGHFLRMLQKADPKIFVENGNYARMCMVTNFRQPVVLSKQEKEELDKSEFGQGVDNFIEYGSDPSNQNVYFCPRIWCPESKVPMTPEQYEKYKVCPKGENPILMYDHSYWDNNPQVKHNIGFHTTKGENGLCLPCCMKREKKPAALQKELQECAAPLRKETALPKAPVATEEEPMKEEYYLMTQSAPLPKGRFGVVPKPLHDTLYPNVSHALCSKVLTSQECLVRRGIDHENDSLLAAIAGGLGLGSKKELLRMITKKIDPLTFITLEDGNILTLFAPENPIIPSKHTSLVKRWNEWIRKHNRYISLFKLESILGKKVSELNEHDTMRLSRELSVFDAYERFIQYLRSEEPKNPYLLYDILRMSDVLLLLWEKQDNDTAHLYCPFYKSVNELLDALAASQTAILLLKDGDWYEPLELKQRNKKGVDGVSFVKAQRMIDTLHSCKGDANGDQMRAILASILSFNMWVDQALILPSLFKIHSLVLSPSLKITHGITKSNLLITFPFGGISIGFLPRIMEELHITKIFHHEDIEGTVGTSKFVATDFQIVMAKLSSIGFGIDAGRVVTSTIMQNVTMYETVTTIPPSIGTPVLKANVTYTFGYEAKDKKWHQLQLLVGKMLLAHYETYVKELHSKTRAARVRILMDKRFPHIVADRDMLQAVLEEMPLEYGKQELANWLRRISYPQKYPFLDDRIHRKRNQYIFSQVAVEKGLPRDVTSPGKGPRPSTKMPQIDAQEEITPSNISLSSTSIPAEMFNISFEQLPSKWTQIKAYQWVKFQMGKISDYNASTLWELLEWTSIRLMMPVKRDEIVWLRNKMVTKSLTNTELMSLYMEDPSFLQEWNTAFHKKYVDAKQLMQRAYIPALNNATTLWKGIVDKNELWPGALDLYIFAKIVQCSVLVLHRAPYGEGNKKRGDITDLGVSSTFYTKEYTDKYVMTKPLIIFYRTYKESYTEYAPIVDESSTFLHKSVKLSPKDVQDLISYHIQNKTNKFL